MAGFLRVWAPRAGWFGANLVNTETNIGTGGVSVADSTTTSYILPVPGVLTSYSKAEAILVGLNFSISVAAVSAAGTVLMQAFKRNNQGTPADVTLTGTKSIEADVVTTTQYTYSFPITASDASCLFLQNDMCRIDVVTTNTVGTQPNMRVSGMWAIRRAG